MAPGNSTKTSSRKPRPSRCESGSKSAKRTTAPAARTPAWATGCLPTRIWPRRSRRRATTTNSFMRARPATWTVPCGRKRSRPRLSGCGKITGRGNSGRARSPEFMMTRPRIYFGALALFIAGQGAAQETLPGAHPPDVPGPAPAPGTASRVPQIAAPEIYRDPAQPLQRRVADLVRRMSLAEKAAQLRNGAPAIPRLGVPAYDYWSEAAHGVANQGLATVFPQAIGNAASFNLANIRAMGHVIGVEGRGKFNDEFARTGASRLFRGLTFWAPNINIFRDPRWGRGQETYGEDPFLTARMGVAFIEGVQGDDPNYYLALACAKHYAVHSGP